MAKKQADRRPDEKPAKPNPARPDATKDPGRRQAEGVDSRTGYRKSGGEPEQRSRPGRDDKDFFGGDRSDRESGRPIQLDEDDPS